jgi:hypothetical protein
MARAHYSQVKFSKNLLTANNAHYISEHYVSPAHSSKVALWLGGIADLSFISNTNRAAFS